MKEKVQMKCPCCGRDLTPGELRRFQNLDEHICRPNAEPSLKQSYVCLGNCAARNCFWDEDGELYGALTDYESIEWIDDNCGAMPSFARQMNVELRRHNEDRYYKIPIWPLKGWAMKIVYAYKADEYGKILKRRRKFEWIRPDGTLYISGLRMLRYSLRQIRQSKRELKDRPDAMWCKKWLNDFVEHADWPNAEWWRKVAGFLAKRVLRKHEIAEAAN